MANNDPALRGAFVWHMPGDVVPTGPHPLQQQPVLALAMREVARAIPVLAQRKARENVELMKVMTHGALVHAELRMSRTHD